MRLDNLQVVNAFMDGPWRFRRNWLRRNDRDLASLAWRLANDRQMAGLGSTTVLHQLGHPEKRKRPEQFDTHEVYNSKADALTHQLNDLILSTPPSAERSTATPRSGTNRSRCELVTPAFLG